MTLLVASIMPRNLAELSTMAERAWKSNPDAVELRIDGYTNDLDPLPDFLRAHADRTWIVTCRSAKEGGRSTANGSERARRLVTVTHDTGAYIDFEYADWLRSDQVREQLLGATATQDFGTHHLILSAHDFSGDSMDMRLQLNTMREASETACLKVAKTTSRIDDSFAALDAMHEAGRRAVAIAMGEAGLWTRVLAKKLGAFATYCALDADTITAPGQLTLDEMVDLYRWADINESTRVFGVLGDPVGHSMSPALFNRWFAESDINAVYLPLLADRNADSLKRFLDGCRQRPWLDIGGFSVTIPHKSTALQWVGDGADRLARWIGAINTLTFGPEQVSGLNTDCYAAVSAVVNALRCERCDLAGTAVDILGSGGSARAVILGLFQLGCELTVYGRSEQKTRTLAEEFGAQAKDWEQRSKRRGELLINCTSVGMWPHVDESPMSEDSLRGCRLVFDLVYHPLETKLLREARAIGASTLSGLDMFIRQAATQFELWTGALPDVELARQLVTDEIARRMRSPS